MKPFVKLHASRRRPGSRPWIALTLTALACHSILAQGPGKDSGDGTLKPDKSSGAKNWNVDLSAELEALPTVPEGFEASLFASEPMVRQPCSMAFDAKGRLFVGMGPQYRNPKPETPGDSVVMLEDTDGDGKADRKEIFATGFNCIQSLAWHGRDLWVANSPDLTLVRDLDGDGKADEYVRIYTDLGNLEHGLHGLNWGPDGMLYMSKGNSKGLNTPERYAPKAFRDLFGLPTPAANSADIPPPQTFRAEDYRHAFHDPADDWGRSGGVLRCADGGGNLELLTQGLRNPWDIGFDSGFNWLGTDNDQNEGDRLFMPFRGAHFGWNHPWSSNWTGENHAPTAPVSGPVFHGSGTGVVFGDSAQFPPEFRGVWFINDWLRKTMFVYRPQWQGALLQPKGGQWEEFVKGGSSLFRPVDMEFGPDGALWCLGWSRGYGAEWKDDELTNEGRIYRIVWKAGTRAEKQDKPAADLSLQDLLGRFNGPLPVWRSDAQEELIRRGAGIKAELISHLRGGKLSQAQETWTAWTLGRMTTADAFFESLLTGEASLNLRLQAVRILAHRAAQKAGPLPAAVLAVLRDKEVRLRFAAVQAVDEAAQPGSVPALVHELGMETDRVTFYSAWQALRKIASVDFKKSLLTHAEGGVRCGALLALLEDHMLTREAVLPLAKDADPRVQEVAELWLRKTSSGIAEPTVRGRPIVVNTKLPTVQITPPAQPTTVEATLPLVAGGNALRGAALFQQNGAAGCFACHQVAGYGNPFGPDLNDIGSRADARHIVQSILEPNAVITEGFNLITVQTAEVTQAGVLLEESGLTVTLGLPTGQRATISKAKITSRQSAPVSAMPPYAMMLQPQDVADIAAWLLKLKAGGGAADEWPKGKGFQVEQKSDRLIISHDGQPVAHFVFQDDKILRPYFAHVHTPGGGQVTRNHPPIPGKDATDHDTMHPGLWLGFGDISGTDFWRNGGRIEHVRFSKPPEVKKGRLRFTTESNLVTPDKTPVAMLTNQITLAEEDGAWQVTWEARFHAEKGDVTFGDQEEMGFGARVATLLTEKNGGSIRNSAGQKTAKKTWGQPADWTDYSGSLDGQAAGITLMAAPGNFRPSWWHNRDYGLVVANPFGRAAMKQGDKSTVTLKQGDTLRLVFRAVLHRGEGYDPARSFTRFAKDVAR